MLQIFQGEKRNTFVWIRLDEDNQNCTRLSIDLTRFSPQILQKHEKIQKKQFQQLEIFVNSPKEFSLVKDVAPFEPNKNYLMYLQALYDEGEFLEEETVQV